MISLWILTTLVAFLGKGIGQLATRLGKYVIPILNSLEFHHFCYQHHASLIIYRIHEIPSRIIELYDYGPMPPEVLPSVRVLRISDEGAHCVRISLWILTTLVAFLGKGQASWQPVSKSLEN